MQNGLQLNPDKSEALIVGTSSQLTSTSAMSSVSVAGVDLPVADEMKVLGVIIINYYYYCYYFQAYIEWLRCRPIVHITVNRPHRMNTSPVWWGMKGREGGDGKRGEEIGDRHGLSLSGLWGLSPHQL